jgi:hypothetical protein
LVINDNPKEQTIKSFSKLRTIVCILLYAAIICFAFAINSFRHSNPTITGLSAKTELWLGIGIGAVILFILYFIWRCPSCKKFLGFNTNPKLCSHCKARLEPDWTKTEKPVMAMFKKKKRLYYILSVLVFVFFIPIFFAVNNPQSQIALIFAIIAGIIDFGILISIFITWRCPNCKSYFWDDTNPKNCPRCGVRLRW